MTSIDSFVDFILDEVIMVRYLGEFVPSISAIYGRKVIIKLMVLL